MNRKLVPYVSDDLVIVQVYDGTVTIDLSACILCVNRDGVEYAAQYALLS